MSATNFSMIWAQLASPYQSSGMVPFVDTDNASITGDVLNFAYDKNSLTLFVANGYSLDLVDTTATPTSPVTINRRAGRFKAAAGSTNVIVNCSLAIVGDVVVSTLETSDATATRVVGRVTVNGTIVFTFNAACTAAITISYVVFKVNQVAA